MHSFASALDGGECILNNCLTQKFTAVKYLEKLKFTQLRKKFPAFYGTRRFITVFTRALQFRKNNF
jgi:hypothetical protein